MLDSTKDLFGYCFIMDQKSKTILVVDDEKDIRSGIVMALEHEGYVVLTAGDGQEGLDIAFEKKPDLIFMDIKMPNLDGLEALSRLRTDDWGKEVPVIMMTMLDDLELMADAVEKGGDEYVLKSDINLEMIVEKVKKRLGE